MADMDSRAPGGDKGRSRSLLRGISTSFLSRGVSALAPLAMIPLMLPALGPSKYGVWSTIVSVTAMLVWADLGLGSGLLTRLSRHLASDDIRSARRDIATTYAIVSVVAVFLAVLALASPWLLSWPRVLGAPAESGAVDIALVSLLSFSVNMPLSLIQRVMYAAQRVGQSNAFTAAGPLISLGLTFLAVTWNASAPAIVLGASLGPPLANLVATIWFFARHRHLIPDSRDGQSQQPMALLALGGQFVLISVFSSVANNADSMIIAQTLGAERVAEYSVSARVMGSMGLLINLVNLPFWPATAAALAQGNSDWVRRTALKMGTLSGVFVMVAALGIMALSKPLIAGLSQDLVERDVALLASLGIWWTAVAVTSPMMMVQNAAGVLGPQLLGWVVFLVVSVPAKWGALSLSGGQIYTAPLVGAVAYCFVIIPLAINGFRRSL